MTSEGRYRRVRRLGQGGTGTVYAAADTLLGRTVALKVLHGAIESDLLHREAQSLARLQHPNVVVLHDLIEDGGAPALVLEFVDGTDLGTWLAERGRPSAESALALFAQVARAVAYGHALGVLHCDIKPSNVLISNAGEVKLTDFTLAHLLEYGRFHGPQGGSVDFAAPEQLGADGAVDERTDIYALGVLLRRLTGPDGGEAIVAAVDRATQPNPGERFESVSAMLNALPVPGDVTRMTGVARASDFTRVLPGRTPAGRRPRVLGKVAVGVAAGAVAVGAVFAGWTMFAAASPAKVTLPNMVATNAPSARLIARSLQLQYHVRRVYSADASSGAVVSQKPLAGSTVPQGATVTLASLSQADAVTRLRHLGLKTQIHTHDTIFQSAGYVLDQSPAPSVKLLPGATVQITVSTTPWWWVF
jgi:serine/threonine-protein kinase